MGESGSLLIATIVLAVCSARPVLDRSRDPDGDVELGRDGLAGLAHLAGVGVPPRVDGGPGGADAGAQLVGERLDQREVRRVLETPAPRDDDRRLVHRRRPAAAVVTRSVTTTRLASSEIRASTCSSSGSVGCSSAATAFAFTQIR